MKTLAYLTAGAGILAATAFFVARPARGPAPSAPRASAALPAEKVAAPAAAAPSAKAGPGGEENPLAVATAPLPYDEAEAGVDSLNETEVDEEIAKLDARLEKERWSDRANRGELKAAEFLKLRSLLHLRNRLFERKLDLAGL
jgi:hypothetical protein